MAYTSSAWAIGPVGGGLTTLSPQPNTDFEPILTGRRGRRDGGEIVNGKDGIALRWGGGQSGSLSQAQFLVLMGLWNTAKANAGRMDFHWYNFETDTWSTSKAIMMRPQSRPMGSDGTGPRHFNVVVEMRSIGLP